MRLAVIEWNRQKYIQWAMKGNAAWCVCQVKSWPKNGSMEVSQAMEKFIKPAFDDRNVPVAIMVSNQYSPYAGVFFQSLKEHASADHNYDIIVVDMGISAYNKTLLERILDVDNFSIRFVAAEKLIPENVSVSTLKGDYHPDLSVRLLLPHVLDGFDRILAVGVDMLVHRDIADAMEVELHDHCIGAVCNAISTGFVSLNSYNRVLGMGFRDYMENVLHMHSRSYLNACMILYDVNKYCSRVPTDLLGETMKTPGIIGLDEGVLNMLLDGDFEQLPLKWNWEPPLNKRALIALEAADEHVKQHYYEAENDLYLLHFYTRPKPWVCPDVPYGDEWWSVAQQTPFMGHIIARMVDELQVRREYYQERYGQSVQVWDPMPNVKRDI